MEKEASKKMKQHLNPFFEVEEVGSDLAFEAQLLETNNKEAEMLIKKGYKIKKPVWTGLVAS